MSAGTIGATRKRYSLNRFLRWTAIPALAYAAVILLALVIWPATPGVFASGASLVGRWLSALNGVFTIGVALFIMRRVPNNACGPLLLLWGVGVLGWSQPIDWRVPALSTLMGLFYQWYFFGVAFSALVVLLYAFPTGHIVPTRFRLPLLAGVLVVVSLSVLAVTAASPADESNVILAPNPLYIPTVAAFTDQIQVVMLMVPLLMMLGAVASLGWRYRHAAYRERQQVKFLVFGFALLTIQAIFNVLSNGVRTVDESSAQLTLSVVRFMAWQALPAIILAVTIARYKLWDIDLVIRRTVSYAILTAMLLLVYFGTVVVLQRLFTSVTGQGSTLATILSTLLIAALFLPLRRRVQDWIDRRFYRRKYNAAKVLEGFAATARDETDLDRLTAELVRVIQETMEPESVSVWLRPTTESRPPTAAEGSKWQAVGGAQGS